jgi:hypothetical protein
MCLHSRCTLALHLVAETLSIPALQEGNKKTLTDWVRVHCGAGGGASLRSAVPGLHSCK